MKISNSAYLLLPSNGALGLCLRAYNVLSCHLLYWFNRIAKSQTLWLAGARSVCQRALVEGRHRSQDLIQFCVLIFFMHWLCQHCVVNLSDDSSSRRSRTSLGKRNGFFFSFSFSS